MSHRCNTPYREHGNAQTFEIYACVEDLIFSMYWHCK